MINRTPTADDLIKGCYFTQDEARRAIAEIKADAWDEGHSAGDEYGYSTAKAEDLGGPDVNKERNPYRSSDE